MRFTFGNIILGSLYGRGSARRQFGVPSAIVAAAPLSLENGLSTSGSTLFLLLPWLVAVLVNERGQRLLFSGKTKQLFRLYGVFRRRRAFAVALGFGPVEGRARHGTHLPVACPAE